MRLIRVGEPGAEHPAMLTQPGVALHLGDVITDLDAGFPPRHVTRTILCHQRRGSKGVQDRAPIGLGRLPISVQEAVGQLPGLLAPKELRVHRLCG